MTKAGFKDIDIPNCITKEIDKTCDDVVNKVVQGELEVSKE